MKKIIVMLMAIMAFGFSQTAFNRGAFFKDIPFTALSNYTQIGELPQRAVITSIMFAPYIISTNTGATNSIQIGTVGNSNFFMTTQTIPAFGLFSTPTTALSNVFVVVSSNVPTPMYVYMTKSGGGTYTGGGVKVVVNYIQR